MQVYRAVEKCMLWRRACGFHRQGTIMIEALHSQGVGSWNSRQPLYSLGRFYKTKVCGKNINKSVEGNNTVGLAREMWLQALFELRAFPFDPYFYTSFLRSQIPVWLQESDMLRVKRASVSCRVYSLMLVILWRYYVKVVLLRECCWSWVKIESFMQQVGEESLCRKNHGWSTYPPTTPSEIRV